MSNETHVPAGYVLAGQVAAAGPVRYHEAMQCNVRGITYDFGRRIGFVLMGEGSCVDMSGCIEHFKAIDTNVCGIITADGDRVDTCYRKTITGEWKAEPGETFSDLADAWNSIPHAVRISSGRT